MKAVYKTSDPATIAQYEANEAAAEANTEAVKAFFAKVGAPEGAQIFGSRLFVGGATFVGITWGDEPVPDGWRIPVDLPRHIEPDRRTKLGKQIDAEMRNLRRPNVKTNLGMPLEIWDLDDHRRYWFGLRRVGDTLWAAWGVNPDDVRDAPVIGEQWERVPLSTYYAMVEAGEDPFADGQEAAA